MSVHVDDLLPNTWLPLHKPIIAKSICSNMLSVPGDVTVILDTGPCFYPRRWICLLHKRAGQYAQSACGHCPMSQNRYAVPTAVHGIFKQSLDQQDPWELWFLQTQGGWNCTVERTGGLWNFLPGPTSFEIHCMVHTPKSSYRRHQTSMEISLQRVYKSYILTQCWMFKDESEGC